MSSIEEFLQQNIISGQMVSNLSLINAPPKYLDLTNDYIFVSRSSYPNLSANCPNSFLECQLEQEINNPTPLTNDWFGVSVSINSTGDRVVVGSYYDDTGAIDAGSVYVYSRSDTTWTLEQEINNPSPVLNDWFGQSVAIDSTGDRIVVGAHVEDTGASAAGSVYIYSRSSTTWTLEQEINNPTPVTDDLFGYSVSINSTGDRIVVGAYGEDTGASAAGSVYIYSRSGTTWSLEQEINNPTPAASDYFGYSVSINSTGDRIVVGAYLEDTGASGAGSAYVYSRSGTTWSIEQEINNPSPAASDYFGSAVSINSTGDRIVVGAYLEDTGSPSAGSAYVYSRSGTTWTLEQEINNPSPVINDYFGSAVSINSTGDRIVVGASGEDTGAGDAGSVYVYALTENTTDLKLRGVDNYSRIKV